MLVTLRTSSGVELVVDVRSDETLGEALFRHRPHRQHINQLCTLWKDKERGFSRFTAPATVFHKGQQLPVVVHSDDSDTELINRAMLWSKLSAQKRASSSPRRSESNASPRERSNRHGNTTGHHVRQSMASQFMGASADAQSMTRDDVSMLFDLIDANKDGALDENELRGVCVALSLPVDKLIQVMDDNGDSKISKDEFMQWWYSEKSPALPVSSRSARGNGTAAAHSPAMNGTKATSREQQGPPRLARGHSLDIQPQNRLVEPPVPASSYPAVSAADFDPDSWSPFPSQSSPTYETYDAASMPVMQHLVPSAHVQSSADGWAAVQAARRQQNAKRVIEEKFRLLQQTCQELQQAMMELLDDPSHLRHAAL